MKATSFTKRHIAGILTVLLVTFVIVGGWFLIARNHKPAPTNLGPQLEYVGRQDLGCQFPLMFFFCDSEAYSEYFFATDLKTSEMTSYFSKATYVEDPNHGGGGNGIYRYENLFFKTPDSKGFTIAYYNNTPQVIKDFHLKPTNKQYIISITDKDYELARQAL